MLGFSNLLWGYFVRSLPSVAGLLGYSVATFASLIAIGIAILYGLRSSTRDWLVSIALLCGVLVLPVLFPQFTVNAGLLVQTIQDAQPARQAIWCSDSTSFASAFPQTERSFKAAMRACSVIQSAMRCTSGRR